MKKNKILIILMFIFVFLVSCNNKSEEKNTKESKISTDEQRQKYINKAQTVIKLFNDKKSKEILEISSIELQNAMTKDNLNIIYEKINSMGEFKDFSKNEVTNIEEKNKNYIVVIQSVKYSKGELIYTISFDENDKLAGVFYK